MLAAIAQDLGNGIADIDIGMVQHPMLRSSPAKVARPSQQFPVRGVFEDLLQGDIGEPDVSLAINAKPVRHGEHTATPSIEKLSRASVEHRHRGSVDRFQVELIVGRPTSIGAMKHKDAIVLVNIDPGHRA